MKANVKIYNEISFNLYYGDFYCDRFDSMKKAINRAKQTFKDNERMTGEYSVYLESDDIRTLVAVISNNH